MEGSFVAAILSAVSLALCRAFLSAGVVSPHQTVMPALPAMNTFISQLAVSLNHDEEHIVRAAGFKQIQKDLNEGAGGNYIYLWYKEGPTAITRLQVTFNAGMATGLSSAGYTKIDKDLNAGAGGDYIYLWYHRGSGEYDTPIVGVDVTTDAKNEAAMFGGSWERLACDLNRGARGAWIHLWLKRENQTYIGDIIATNSYGSDAALLGSGFVRVDEDTNRGAGGSFVFIWYRQTTDSEPALTDLQVSVSNMEASFFQKQGYTPASVDLNDGTSGHSVYLWYKRGASRNPIKAIALLVNTALVDESIKAGLNVIVADLNTGNQGSSEYLCVYQ